MKGKSRCVKGKGTSRALSSFAGKVNQLTCVVPKGKGARKKNKKTPNTAPTKVEKKERERDSAIQSPSVTELPMTTGTNARYVPEKGSRHKVNQAHRSSQEESRDRKRRPGKLSACQRVRQKTTRKEKRLPSSTALGFQTGWLRDGVADERGGRVRGWSQRRGEGTSVLPLS